jgi:hypothetical protein
LHGADPDLEHLGAAADPLRRLGESPTVGEGLDVGVVSIIESALLANHLIEM